jgi:Photosynthesis system II assembly factor YCF48
MLHRQALLLITATLLLAGCGGAAAPGPAPTAADAAGSSTPGTAPSPAATATASPVSRPAAGCHSQHVALTGRELTGIEFVSASQGWVVGQHDILATTDGGATWTVQDQGRLNLTAVDFVDDADGWAAGTSSLLRTTDGGQTWMALPDPCPGIRSVHFATPQAGFAIAGGVNLLGAQAGRVPTTAPQRAGMLLATTDGGQTWSRLAAPPNPQTVCFSTPADGWLGANGGLYYSSTGGRSWHLLTPGPVPQSRAAPYTMLVQCAGPDVWADDIGAGVGMNQQPHVGYYAAPAAATPIFAEQYFPHPGVTVTASSPGAYSGAISAIGPATAAYVEWCPACGLQGTVPWVLASDGGRKLVRAGQVTGLDYPVAASFLSPEVGWVIGGLIGPHGSPQRIVRTVDGGASWVVQYGG